MVKVQLRDPPEFELHDYLLLHGYTKTRGGYTRFTKYSSHFISDLSIANLGDKYVINCVERFEDQWQGYN